MSRDIFGTDGVRAIAGQYPLDSPTIRRIAMAVGLHFGQSGKYVLLGNDTRASSDGIIDNIAEGIKAMGVDVRLVGVIPTPGLAYLTAKTSAAAGVMVTASHNPAEYNGIKVFAPGGKKLTDEQEASLNASIDSEIEARGQGKSEKVPELAEQYLNFLVDSAGGTNLDGLRVAVDSANGASSLIAAKVFGSLGAEVSAMFNQPSGTNINEKCGATDPEALRQKVVESKLDLGIALDGDADRLIMVDGRGREITGDHILYILAVTNKYPEVVATVMSNHGLETSLAAHGIKLRRTKVGDRYILEELRRSNLVLGGEQSGHIVCFDKLPTGDGLLAAVQTLKAVKESGRSLADWRDDLKLLPQDLVNIKLTDKSLMDKINLEELSKSETEALDGQGRVLVRASGTEPLIRVMAEGEDAQKLTEEVVVRLKKFLGIE